MECLTVILLCRYVEYLLDSCLKQYPLHLPELRPRWELSPVIGFDSVGDLEKMNQPLKGSVISRNQKKKKGKSSSPSAGSNSEEKLRQPTLIDVWRKVGATPIPEDHNEEVSVMSPKTRDSASQENQADKSNMPQNIELSAPLKSLDAQKYNFRPLSVDCFSILACPAVSVCLTLLLVLFMLISAAYCI